MEKALEGHRHSPISPGRLAIRPSRKFHQRKPFMDIVGAAEPGGPTLSLDNLILYLLRGAGGRLALVDLQFELRWRGIQPERAAPAIADLVDRKLIRGPLPKSMACELTVCGWDVCAAFAAVWPGVGKQQTSGRPTNGCHAADR